MAKPLVLVNQKGIIPCSYDVLVNITCLVLLVLLVNFVWLFSCVIKGEPRQFSPKQVHLA